MTTHQTISELAYRLWIERGRPQGTHEQDWLEAERRLTDESRSAQVGNQRDAVDPSLDGSFPASDPPATHLPDRPPSNAGEKWRTAKAASPRGSSPDISKRGAHYPVDETDDGPPIAPGDIGEG